MEYLQYAGYEDAADQVREAKVLNLVINGIPSILKQYYLLVQKDVGF